MKKLFVLATLVLFSVSATFAQSDIKAVDAKTSSTSSGAAIKFDQEVFDYGTIRQGEKVTHEFTFVSAGNQPLIITAAQGSCGCTVPEWPKQPLKKGERGSVKVTFDSAGKMGMQDKTVTITSNAGEVPVVLHIKGTIEAAPAGGSESKPVEKPMN